MLLYSNKTEFVDTEIWILYNIYIMEYGILIYFSHLQL